ncbi:hypothetical protein M408DRAFT_273253 [Serendipita vermifera MAFF 305830]|uniref:Uncharacterized protein n=1 Tax=Serendipita vermifera MAFF 305830 TaxID=933852 RepID=A0A0C3BHK6_SERVB|nr:hypothetical protein M408DRAFT_273253 [Serendipita vermifera MAFF 305830]
MEATSDNKRRAWIWMIVGPELKRPASSGQDKNVRADTHITHMKVKIGHLKLKN